MQSNLNFIFIVFAHKCALSKKFNDGLSFAYLMKLFGYNIIIH